jgi:hypothetical protein
LRARLESRTGLELDGVLFEGSSSSSSLNASAFGLICNLVEERDFEDRRISGRASVGTRGRSLTSGFDAAPLVGLRLLARLGLNDGLAVVLLAELGRVGVGVEATLAGVDFSSSHEYPGALGLSLAFSSFSSSFDNHADIGFGGSERIF